MVLSSHHTVFGEECTYPLIIYRAPPPPYIEVLTVIAATSLLKPLGFDLMLSVLHRCKHSHSGVYISPLI